MEYETLEEWIRAENNHQPSVEDQVWIAEWFVDRKLLVSVDELSRTQKVIEETEEYTEYSPKTCMENLRNIGILQEFEPQGGNSLIICERADEIFFTPENSEFPPILAEEVSRFINDMKESDKKPVAATDGGEDSVDKTDIREIAADALDVAEEIVEEEILGTPDIGDRMVKYEKVVIAIKDSEEVERNRDYDEIGWRNRAHRWGLSKRAEEVASSGSATGG